MKKKILLIEDDLPTIDIYKTTLNKSGFEVEALDLGAKALEKIEAMKEKKAEKPDLVLLDLILPDMNGIKILEKIKKEEETKDIPVFILTNYTDEELRKMGYSLKSEQYFLKANFTLSRLVKEVRKRLK